MRLKIQNILLFIVLIFIFSNTFPNELLAKEVKEGDEKPVCDPGQIEGDWIVIENGKLSKNPKHRGFSVKKAGKNYSLTWVEDYRDSTYTTHVDICLEPAKIVKSGTSCYLECSGFKAHANIHAKIASIESVFCQNMRAIDEIKKSILPVKGVNSCESRDGVYKFDNCVCYYVEDTKNKPESPGTGTGGSGGD